MLVSFSFLKNATEYITNCSHKQHIQKYQPQQRNMVSGGMALDII